MKTKKLLTMILILQMSLGINPVSFSEEPPTNENPFGGFETPPPVDPDFQEDDGFLNPPGNNMEGFNPPPVPEGAQPPALGRPTPQPTRPMPPMPSTQPPTNARPNIPAPRRPVVSQPTPPTPPAKSETTAKKGKTPPAAPKLADYLELDSSVKGLEVKNFDLPDKDLKDVVTLISKWTGKNFILDSKVRGKITIMGPSQVSLQEAYQAFLSALDANGLTTVQAGKFIRIIESAEARRAPVQTYSGEYAPVDDQYITRIFQLKYINADEVQREFRDLVTRQGKLFAYEPTNSIIITDTGSNIQRIRGILDSLDVKTYETTLHVLPIKNNSAKAVADMLGEIYGDEKAKPGQPRTFRKTTMERTRGGGVISKVIPDETTNSLLVLANKAGFESLKSLVARLDVKASSGKIRVYYCEHAKAEDLANTLASLAGGGSAGRGTSGSRRTSANAGGAPGGAPAAVGSSGPVSAELEGGVKITSDAATNSLVITANSNDYKTLRKVLRKLDIPRLQVFVETAILEVNVNNSTKLGTNITAAGPGKAFAGGFIGDAGTLKDFFFGGLPDGATIPFQAGNLVSGSIGGTTINGLGNLNGVINLLAKEGNATVLSTPQIIALDNEKAELQVLDDTPVVASTIVSATSGSGGLPQVNVERLKTGINIKLTPHVNAASRTIRLELEQKIDSFRQLEDVPTQLQSTQRALTSRVTNTSVVVKDGDYLMMGGLMSDKVDDTISKVPLLGDIPILGWLFKSKTFKTTKTNLIILLRPKVIGTSVAAANVIKDSLQRRKDFIEETLGGNDEVGRGVEEISDRVDQQAGQGTDEPFERYRNNEDSEDEDKPQVSAKPEEPKADGSSNSPALPLIEDKPSS
jgi:general secretion pathway protein D